VCVCVCVRVRVCRGGGGRFYLHVETPASRRLGRLGGIGSFAVAAASFASCPVAAAC